ncbi:AI-2E family transporter [Vaginisenegalia massiliensis]|uniref:AI-2E family transporter n=1 Tax=Vaginisenegalia massiliensis TaxID=2058294 RepID=UPI000F532DD3|nr:AI-2E family transporter [Vaginisenegalia massiliensis]
MEKIDRLIMKYLLILALIFLAVMNSNHILRFIGQVFNVLTPVFMGFAIAYVVNVLMSRYEKFWFRDKKDGWQAKYRRPICMALAFLTIGCVLTFITWLVVPQFISAIGQFAETLPAVAKEISNWTQANKEAYPQISTSLKSMGIDIQAVLQNLVTYFNGISKRVLSGSVTFLATTATNILNLVLAIMLSFYILSTKETLQRQADKILSTYLNQQDYVYFKNIVKVADESFANFFAGEVIEAFILGILVTSGMFILKLPFAGMIGAVTGILVLIPVLGAYLSAVIGFIIILTVSFKQACFFVIFITVIQQLEGNLIYPKIVGGSIGLPGLWVLVSVTVFGGLFGIPGMLIGVPLAATLYKLLRQDINNRQQVNLESSGRSLIRPALERDDRQEEGISLLDQ